MQTLAALALAAAGPLVLIVHAVWCAILKDGTPLRREWWTAGPKGSR